MMNGSETKYDLCHSVHMTTAEQWKPVTGYEGIYEVSDQGRVRNRKGRVLSASKGKQGYLSVWLCRDGRGHRWALHRLVARAFCEMPPGKNVVNHKDNNPTNNRAANLEFVTQKENVRHALSIGAATARPVVRSDGKYYPIMKMVEADGFSRSNVCHCCRGGLKTHKGYGWSYANTE